MLASKPSRKREKTKSREEAEQSHWVISPSPRREPGSASASQLRLDARRLGRDDPASEISEPIVAPALVIKLGVGPLIELFDQTFVEQSVQRAIQRSRSNRFIGPRPHVDENRIAVPIFVRERDENLEYDRRERQEV